MKNKTLLYIILVLAISLLLYLFLPYKNVNSTSELSSKSGGFSFVSLQEEFISKQTDSLKDQLNLNIKLTKSSDDSQKIDGLTNLIAIYNQSNEPILAAWTVYQKAKNIKNTNSWEITGDNFISLLTSRQYDSTINSELSKLAVESYENSYKLDSNNTAAQIKMARCYMEIENQPMKGIQELLSIVRQDENNIDAQLLLAKFGLVSGQYEKVQIRLEKVLSLQPQNIDALLMRADMYSSTGKKEAAIKDLRSITNLPNVPQEMKVQIERSIENLKKAN